MLRVVQRDKGSLAAHLKRHEREGAEEDACAVDRQVNQLRIVGEDADDRTREKEHHDPHQDIDQKTAEEDEIDALGDTFIFLCTVVITHDVLPGGRDAAVRQTHDLPYRIRQAHRADVERAEGSAPGLQHDVHDGLREAARDAEGKACRAELEKTSELLAVDEKMTQAKRRPLTS